MARRMFGSEAAVYRAVVTYKPFDRPAYVGYFGPFRAKTPATQVINREIAERARRIPWERRLYGEDYQPEIVTGVVEKATLTWETVK